MKKTIVIAVVGLFSFLAAGFAILTLANIVHDRSDPRSRPHAYYSVYSMEVDRPVDQMYDFVKYRIPGIYTEMSAMHEKFEILNANGLVEGAEIDCIEGNSGELVHNHYVVTKAVENRLIQLESTPSIVYDRETEQKVGESNTYVYFDFEAINGGRTRLSQTIVLDMQSPLYKSVADIAGFLTGGRDIWEHHFQEELVRLADHIERS